MARKPKQSAQPKEQSPWFGAFCVWSLGTLWWWSQSGIAATAPLAAGAALAKLTDAGNATIAAARSMTKIVRPIRCVTDHFANVAEKWPDYRIFMACSTHRGFDKGQGLTG